MNSRLPLLWAALLLVALFCLGTRLAPRLDGAGRGGADAPPLASFLGQSRRLFADHFFIKADKYFHSGYYPTMFDDQTAFHTPHMALYPNVIDQEKAARDSAGKKKWMQNVVDVNDEAGSPGQAHDWIEGFGRQFFPVKHTHLDQHGEKGEMRELLPWLRLTAELDPVRVETFVVTAYWLRTELGRADEAERFLREGLRANPGNPEMLFEMGRVQRESRQDAERARNFWELAAQEWHERETAKPEPNTFLLAQIISQLATLEEEQGRLTAAWQHLQTLRAVSAFPAAIADWERTLWGKLAAAEAAHPFETL